MVPTRIRTSRIEHNSNAQWVFRVSKQARGPRHKMALSGILEIIFLHFVPVKVIVGASSEHTKCLRAASAPVPRLTQYDLQSTAFSCVKLEEFLADPVGI